MPVIYDRRQRLIAALLRQRTYAGAIVLEILSRRPLDDLEVGTTALKQQGLDFTLGR